MPSTFNIEFEKTVSAEDVANILSRAGFVLNVQRTPDDHRAAFFPGSRAPVFLSIGSEPVREYEPNVGSWTVGVKARFMPSIASIDEDMALIRKVVDQLTEGERCRFALSHMYESIYAYRSGGEVVWVQDL